MIDGFEILAIGPRNWAADNSRLWDEYGETRKSE